MAKQKGKNTGQAPKRPRLNYFFLNDQLHKKLHINRGQDIITAWNYPEGKRVLYNYSFVLRKMKPAYTTTRVCELVNRSKETIDRALRNGMIRMPQYTYGLTEKRHKFQYMWREEDILELHEYLSGIHIGRPRLDEEITNNSIPTPRELRALLAEDTILYVKQGDKYVPSWKAKEI